MNTGNGKFEDATETAGDDFLRAIKAHRGSAFGDFDGDGKLDIVVSALGDSAELWRNTTSEPGNWVAFKLTGTKSNRDGIGARIRVGKQFNEMTSSVGYSSSSLVPVWFGVGALKLLDDVEIHWPSGTTQRLHSVPVNRVIDVREPGP